MMSNYAYRQEYIHVLLIPYIYRILNARLIDCVSNCMQRMGNCMHKLTLYVSFDYKICENLQFIIRNERTSHSKPDIQ